MKNVAGIVPILATPFTETGEVDYASYRRIVEAAIQDGAHGLAMFGLASEYYKLRDAERTRLTEALVQQTRRRVPVIVSITHHARHVAVQQAREAVAMGADALMVMPPFFLSPSVAAIMGHVEAIARAVEVPVIVQYAPLQTGRFIDAAAFVELHGRCLNVTHVKVDLVPSGSTITALRQASGGTLQSLVGYAGLHLPEDVERGVSGCMPSVSLTRAFVHAWELLRRNEQEGRAFHHRLLPLLNFMMQSIELMNATEKLLLLRRGIIATAACREPALQPDSFQMSELDRYAQDLAEWLPQFLPTITIQPRAAYAD